MLVTLRPQTTRSLENTVKKVSTIKPGQGDIDMVGTPLETQIISDIVNLRSGQEIKHTVYLVVVVVVVTDDKFIKLIHQVSL